MIKRFLYYVLLITSFLLFISCKKDHKTLHKVRFELEFLAIPVVGSSNGVEILPAFKPHYEDESVKIYKQYITSGYTWRYEYWSLVDGDEIVFPFWCQNEYHFIMKIFIDNELISFKEMVGLDESGGNYTLVTQWGLNNSQENEPEIKFTFYE